MELFLFDTNLKLLYGVYKATTRGKLGLEPSVFHGRYPAQVRFKVFKDCLPLPESAFRRAIKDNYHGSNFNLELGRKQVKSLISLFHPVTIPTSAAASTIRNVASPPSFPIPPVEGLKHTVDSYVSGAQYQHSRSRQAISQLFYDPYESQAHEAKVQPSREAAQIIQRASFHRHGEPYYVAETHEAYLPEKQSLSAQDLYPRYGIMPDVIPGDREIASHSEFLAPKYSQYLPRIAASNSSQPLTPIPSYVLLPSHPQGELRHAYQYAVPTRGRMSQIYSDPLQRPVPGSSSLIENNLPASRFSFAGVAPTFR